MTAWLLNWNPKNWDWGNFYRDRQIAASGQSIEDTWSCANSAAAKGDAILTVAKLMFANHGRVGYEIEHDAALLIQGRKMQSLGEGKVTLVAEDRLVVEFDKGVVVQFLPGAHDVEKLKLASEGET